MVVPFDNSWHRRMRVLGQRKKTTLWFTLIYLDLYRP